MYPLFLELNWPVLYNVLIIMSHLSLFIAYYVQPILAGLGRPVMHNVLLIISHLGPLIVYDV